MALSPLRGRMPHVSNGPTAREMVTNERLRSISREVARERSASRLRTGSPNGYNGGRSLAVIQGLPPKHGIDDAPVVMAAKLEENLARETVTLRADNADLRISVSDFHQLLMEEKKERQSDVADLSRRLKESIYQAEERHEYLDGLMRARNTQANEFRTALQECEKLRELTELQALQSVADEARLREQALTWERNDRQRSIEELEQRFRQQIREERDIRERENGDIALRLARCDDAIRGQNELLGKRIQDLQFASDELRASLGALERLRADDASQMVRQAEELRSALVSEVRERTGEIEGLSRKFVDLEASARGAASFAERELELMKRALLDVQEASHIEVAKLEKVLTALQVTVAEEQRLRDATVAEAMRKQEAEAERMEQRFLARVREERAVREEVESEILKRTAGLASEQGSDRARAMAACQELGQEIRQTHEQLRRERDVRQREFQLYNPERPGPGDSRGARASRGLSPMR